MSTFVSGLGIERRMSNVDCLHFATTAAGGSWALDHYLMIGTKMCLHFGICQRHCRFKFLNIISRFKSLLYSFLSLSFYIFLCNITKIFLLLWELQFSEKIRRRCQLNGTREGKVLFVGFATVKELGEGWRTWCELNYFLKNTNFIFWLK